MFGFVDEVAIEVSSGDGGDGAVSFRREKYVPKGGPDGGDGGRGGDVVFIVKNNVRTLMHLKLKRVFKAENGRPGMGKRMHGKDGGEIEIPVPLGTLLRDPDSKKIIKDFSTPGERWIFLEGGNGGKGNWHFRSATRQTPRFAIPGKSGKQRKLFCELQVIADIGLVGFPNAGKSTLLSVLTNATPKIGSYPFTTLTPNLGILSCKGHEVVIADIPGIIEGASKGVGLGLTFLRHISRTKLLVFLIDITAENGIHEMEVLLNELSEFSPELAGRERIIVCTKSDAVEENDLPGEMAKAFPNDKIMTISSITMNGIEELKNIFIERTGKLNEDSTSGRDV
ncbi:MAG: GTPase ObgE [Spirochaetales bacterium]|nr:GTPase ObgE [Spirochaetales bacterium]